MNLRPHRRLTARVGIAVIGVVALLLSACGSQSLGGEPGPTGAAPTVTTDTSLADKLPQSIKNKGTIVIGTDASYAPNEFLDPDGKTVVGFDVDLFNAVAAKFGIKTQWMPADFDGIITGVTAKKYDIGISSFTINAQRLGQATMVSYFSAGTQWATQAGNPKQVDPDNACGKTVAVQTGTVQEEVDLPARQAKCGDNKIKILPFKGQDEATAAVAAGRADAMLADLPVVVYAASQSAGKLEPLGDQYDAAPYGYVLPKDQADFGAAIVEALTQLKAEGAYDQIAKKWEVDQGGISDFAVNPTV